MLPFKSSIYIIFLPYFLNQSSPIHIPLLDDYFQAGAQPELLRPEKADK